MTVSADFSAVPESQRAAEITRLCDAMQAAADAGRYPRLTLGRPWSADNPVLQGEFAAPAAIRWYLERAWPGWPHTAPGSGVSPGREARTCTTPDRRGGRRNPLDLRRKKLFLFGPERMALSIDRLVHYTGTPATAFHGTSC